MKKRKQGHNSKAGIAAHKLYGDRADEYLARYGRNKKIVTAIVVAVSLVLAGALEIEREKNPELIQGKYIARNEKMGAAKVVTLDATAQNGLERTLRVEVKEQQYTEAELEECWDAFYGELMKRIYAKEDSPDCVRNDMDLTARLEGYPFSIRWKSDRPLILSGDGRIHEDALEKEEEKEKGIIVTLTAEMTCNDYQKIVDIPVRVYGKEKKAEDAFWEQVDESIELWSEKSNSGEYQKLPDAVDEVELSYREKNEGQSLAVLFCGILVAILLSVRADENLMKRVRERDEQLESQYPQLVNRFTLYYGAGLTIKNIWHRICTDYLERKKQTGVCCVYEEMIKADRQMQDGVGESNAYTEFSRTIGLPRYRSLIGLLQQALQTGGTDIREQLNEQLRDAFSEQKRSARIKGEKAGTKLLMPMFLMLLVVLVMILVPAFLSF